MYSSKPRWTQESHWWCSLKAAPPSKLLLKILRVVWRRGKVANQWKYAVCVRIPKEVKDHFVALHRGKNFFSILSLRLLMFCYNYIDTSVHSRGRTSRIPSCLKHIWFVTQLIREATKGEDVLVVLWLNHDPSKLKRIPDDCLLGQLHLREKNYYRLHHFGSSFRSRFKHGGEMCGGGLLQTTD